jgi:hypothetical protein
MVIWGSSGSVSKGEMSKLFVKIVFAAQTRAICAELGCIKGMSIVGDGEGCRAIL